MDGSGADLQTEETAPDACTAPSAAGRWGFLARDRCWVNLEGDYAYLGEGYYASQDAEGSGQEIHPTCRETLDAYIVPLFLTRAQQAGLTVPEHYVTNGYFEPPVVVDPLNPFMNDQRIVLAPSQRERVARSVTRNHTYAICCQVLPPGARLRRVRLVLGWTAAVACRPLAQQLWEVFRVPLALLRVMALADGQLLPSRLQALPFTDLRPRERRVVDRMVSWPA